MKKLLLIFFLLPGVIFSQSEWEINNIDGTAFIKNQGQFDGRNWQKNKVEYGIENGNFHIFFTKKGWSYRYDKMIREKKDEQKEKHEPGWENVSELVHVTWLNTNKNVEILAENQRSEYFSYAVRNFKTKEVYNINHVHGYKKLIYKNLYDHIDVILEIIPQKGFEYSLLLHPGADINQVKLRYSSGHTNRGDEFIRYYLDELGNVQIKTSLGHIIERDLKSFYSTSENPITAHYNFDNDTLSFQLGNYDHSQEVIIDPLGS